MGVIVHPVVPSVEPDIVTDRVRATWTAGDFGQIAVGYSRGADAFVERLGLVRGESVLDVACGTGNLSLPAARRGASVTGLDIAANLLVSARASAEREALAIRFDEGDAQALPFGDAAFRTVMSMFGVMFAPRPEPAMRELFRVAAPGGRIALASWTKEGFVGAMLRAHVERVPPPAGVPSVLQWGDEMTTRERLTPFTSRIRTVTMTRRMMTFRFP